MIYTIKKDNHYASGIDYRILKLINIKKTRGYNVVFNETALYAFEGQDKGDINKLFGFTVGWIPATGIKNLAHDNSGRFGWACIDGKIKIYAYCYDNHVRYTEELYTVNLNESYTYILANTPNYYLFSISNESGVLKETRVPKRNISGLSFNLWPYFGGNNPAPQDIHISMIEI